MVAPPDFFEVVTDVQLGFNVRLHGDIPPENVYYVKEGIPVEISVC